MQNVHGARGRAHTANLLRPVVQLLLLVLVGLVGVGSVWGQSRIPSSAGNYLQTTGTPQNGDSDPFMVVFFQVDANVTDTIYFAIDNPYLDGTLPDQGTDAAGGAVWSYYLMGGDGVLTGSTAKDTTFGNLAAAQSGATQLELLTFDGPGTGSNGWNYFSGVSASQGERIGDYYYFKIIAQAPNGDKNAFRLDASTVNSGTATGIPGVRAFAYAWTLALLNRNGTPWNMYPFVPDNAVGNVEMHFVDFDDQDYGDVYNTSDRTTALATGLPGAQITDGEDRSFPYSVSGETNGTWLVQLTESTNTTNPNTSVFYSAGTNPAEPYRTYSSDYFPAPPDRVTASPVDGTAVADGTGVVRERVYLQLVDSAGNPVPYVRDVHLAVDGSAEIEATSDEAGPLNATARVVSTDSDGVAWVEVSDGTAEDVTLTITTDGITSALPGPTTSSRLPDTGTLGVNDAPTIRFVPDALPTISSASGTSFNEGTSAQAIATVDIAEQGSAPEITATGDIRITIPTTRNVTFAAGATVSLTVTGSGQVDSDGTPQTYSGTLTYENANKTAVIDVLSDFAASDTIAISGLQLDAAADSDSNFFLELDIDNDGVTDSIDDKLIIVRDTASTYTWTGSTDTVWADQTNWDVGDGTPGNDGYPGQTLNTDNVVVPGGLTNNPVLASPETINDLSIGAGAQLSIGGNVLTVDGTTSNEGRLILSGAAGQGAGLTAGGPFDVDSGVIEYAGGGSLQLNVYNDLEISSGTYTLSSALDVNGDLTLSGGTLNDGGQTISVAGDWTRVGTFAANSDTGGTGTVVFDGAGPTVVSGATTFYNLTIATPGKAVRFTSGETTTVNGTFRAVGENGSLVSLSGTTTAAWTLDNAGGTDVVQYVDVAYSDLIGANSVTAYSSNNGGNNDQETVTDAAQWVFSGTTYTWTGASTTDWFTQGNWDIGDGTPGNDGTPTSSDPVIIPNTATAPVLTANATGGNDVRSIRVEIGGSLDLAGFNLTSANGITNLGTIIAQGNETYTGTINSDSGEVVYDGNGVNNALPFGTSYFDLTVTPSTGGGSITFTDGTSVTVNGALTAGDTNGDTVTFTGGVAAPASTVRGTLASTDAGLSLGTLTLTGNATIQTGGGTLSLGPTDGGASLVLDTTGGAGTGAITLGGAIGGATPLASLTVNAKGAVQFPSVTTTGTLDVAAGGAVTDAGALTIGGTATLAVPGNAITLDSTSNDFQGDVTITDGATDATAVTLVDQNAVQFGGASATQTGLTVSAGGAITDAVGASVVVAAGTASFTTTLAGAPITMDSAGNNFPTFAAAATTTSTVTVVDAGALVLGGVDDGAGGPVAALTLTVGAALTDSGPSLVSGTTTINASGANVTLNDAGNDFGTVTATGAAIGLVDASGLDLGSTNASGNLTVTVAAGNLTDSGEVNVGGDTSIAMNDGTAADITLDDNGDTTYTNTFTGAFLLAGANLRNVTVTDDTAIVLQGNTITGTLSVTAGGAITQTGGLVVGGTATFNAGTAAVTLGLGANDFDSDNTGDAVTASSTGAAVSIRDGTGSMTVGAVTAGAEVTLRADGLNLTGAISANGGAANTYLLPDTTTTAVSLGGAAGFDLTQTELLQIAAGTGTIVIGKDAVPTVTAGAVTAGASAAVNIGARNLEIEGASIAVGPNTFTTAGSLALVSAGVIDGTANDATADLSAGTLALTAGTGGTGGIGTGTTIDVAASVTLSADTTGSNANIVLDTIGAVQVALVDAGTGNVTLGAGGAVTTASDDATADISGAVVDVTTAAGGVGASSASVDITATASLAVNTTAANGAVYIDGIGAGGLALALVDAGAGAVVLTAAEIDGVTDDGVADLAGSAISLTTTTANGIGTASPLDLDASGALTVDSTTGNGNVTIDALTALAVATINGGTGTVTLDALATVDDDTATDTTTDITAATLVLTAVDGVGSTQDLDLDVDNVSVTVAGTGASNSIVLQSNNTAATTISQLRTNGADISFTHNTTSTVTVASVAGQEVWSGTGGNGGNISISAPNSTTVTLAGDVDSSGGTGGTLSINGVIVNTAPTVGQGNISVTGGGDVQIAAPVTFNASRTITSNGDIILGAAVATAGGAYDLTLVADNDGDGAGGIWIQAAGKAEAAQNLILRGSRIINGGATATGAPALNPAVQIDADGANAQAESGTNGTGTLTIERNAAAPTQDTDILINGAVVARGGFTVTASRGILLNAATANLSSNNGAVSFTADNDGGNTGGITMADGSSINAGSGTISLAAYDDVTLGGAAAAAGLETTNATGAAVSVTSSNGAILDGGDTGLDIVANGAGAATTLSAATGIGHDGTTSNALEITVADLDAATTANNVEITESDGLTVSRAATGNGDVTLISTTGNIAVGSAATPAISAGTGTATLTATGGAIDDAATDTLADINADTIDLNAASGIGATEALELASAPTITADTTTGAIGLTHAADAGTTLSSASIATGTIDFAQTGGQTLDVTSAVTSTSGTITITNAGANLTATSVSAGTGAAADGDVSLTTTGSGTVLLGSVSAAADTVSVSSAADVVEVPATDAAADVSAGSISLTAGTGGAGAVGTAVAGEELEIDLGSGSLSLTTAGVAGDIHIAETAGRIATSAISTVSTPGGSVTIVIENRDAGFDVDSGAAWPAGGSDDDITLSALNLTASAGDDDTLFAASSGIATTGIVTLDTVGAVSDAGGDTTTDVAAASLVGTSATGFGAAGDPIETTVANLDIQNSTSGGVVVAESDGLQVNRATTVNDVVTIASTTGDISVGSTATPAISAGTGTVTLTATGGAIDDAATDTLADIDADTVDLNASTGIGATEALELASAPTITANTTTGAVDLTHAADAGTTLSSASTATGTIDFSQTGGQTLDVTSAVTSTSGTITITNAGANLTATSVSAGTAAAADGDVSLTTTGSGSVLVDAVSAGGDTVTVTSAAGIEESGTDPGADIAAATIDLNAVTGIGNAAQLEMSGTAVTLDSSAGGENIDVDVLTGGSDVALNSATIAVGAGTITLDVSGGGNLATGGNITTANGAIDVSVDSGNLDLSGDTVSAGGVSTISLDTTTSGDITLGTLDAGGDTVTINSVGDIDDDGAGTPDITTDVVNLNAVSGIGGTQPVELAAVTSVDVDNSGTGVVDVTNAATGAVTVNSLTNDTGAVDYAQTGGRTLDVTSASTTTSGTITITNAGANLTATSVSAGTGAAADGDVSLTTTGSGTVLLGSVSAAADTVSVSGAAAISDNNGAANNVTALRWNATADSGMGFGDAIETTIGELNATNATSNTIEVTEADGFTVLQAANTNGDVTLISTTGNVAVDSTGGGVSADVATGTATVTATAGTITATNATAANEVVAATINLNAVNGTIGAGNQLDVNAVTALNADTSTGNGTITVTDTAGDLPLGVVTTGAVGAGTVTLNAAAGSIADTNGATVNVTAGSTVLRALTDIGALASAADVTVALNANAIETQTAAVDVATTNAGSEAAIANSGAALDVAALGVGGANGGFVRIENDGNNLTVDTGASGAVLTNGAGEGLEGNDDIALVTTTSGTITVHDEGAVGVQDIATTGTVYLDAIGAIDDSQGATDLYIAAGTLYLNSDAATDTTARTAVTTLNSDLSGGSGALVINEDSGITLATIATANANVTVTDTGGDIIVGSVNAGSGTVALTASSGSIYDDGDAGVDITAATGTANLNANGVIGTGGNDLETTVANLVVNTGTGNAVMTETDDLVVSGASSVAGNLVLGLNAGNLTQSNTLAVTGTTQITTTGSITLNNAGNDFGGAVSTAGNPTTVTLRDANAIQLGGITTTGGGGGTAIDVATVNGGITVGNTLDASGAATAAVSLVAAGQDSDVTVNAAVTTDTADITITADDSVSIAAATTLSTGAGVAGDIVVTANNATTAGDSGDQVTMAADSVLEAGGAVATGVVTVTANGANAGSVALGDLRGSAVTVSADQAAITDAGAGATNVTTAGTFTADSASGIGTSVNPIETTIATLDAQVTGAGGVYVTETDDVTVTQAQTGNGDVTLVSSGGSLTVDTVVTDTTNDVVTLTAANAIVDGNGATNNVTAFRLNATADSGIGSGDAIETAVGELDLTNTTGNAIEVTEADAVTVTGIVQSGAGSVLVSAGATMTLTDDVTSVGGAITLSATTIDLDDTTDDALAISSGGGGGDVTLNAPVDAVGATADSLTLTAGSGNVVIPSAVGGGARLGALTIASAANVAGNAGATADTGTITAATVTQTAGTGTSRFAQIDTNAAGGVDLNGAAFALNGGVTTTAGGALTVTNSGTLTIADTTGPADTATVDIDLDGAFTQDGAGGVSVAGDIATTNDAVSFAAPVTVFGDTGVDAGSATITFGNTVSGTSGGEIEDLTINSVGDTGSVVFNGVIGVGQALEGNLDVVAATDVDLVGIEETGASAAGVSGTVSVAAAGTITLAGTADFRTAGAQDYRATGGSAIGAIMAQTGASTVAAGGNGITFEDLYIDANGVTITIPDGETVTANDIVVYRGTIALTTTPGNAGSGATVQTTASGGGDFVVFGPSYSADDTDRGASANEFAYPPADAGPGLAYTLGGSYTQATGAWGTAPNAAFADLSGATITVGSGGTGDFYVNGADLPATANWTLNVQDNSAANPLANPPFGQPYAVAFYKASVGVEYSQVTGGSISAAEPLPPGANNSAHQNNDYRDGGNNLVYVPDPDGSGPGTATPGWDFDPLMLISAETVKDNWIRLTFNEPVENTAGLIETAVASGVAANGDPYFDTGGTAAAFDATGVDADDALPFSFTTTNTGIDLTTFYVRAPATRSWNTDATGSAASASGTGTDRTGASQTTVPNLSWLKGVFFDAGGHNPVINYTENATTTFAATTDEAGPVLYRVEYGRAAHDEPLTTPYDGHNYYHLFWSEPVSIGSDPGMQSGAATPSQNLRAEDAVGDSTGQGGDIVMSGADLLVDGFFRYDDPQGVGTGFNRGWRTGTAPANALYRRDTFSGGQFTNSDQELRIYLSGYNEDWTAPSTWGGSDLFPGWHTGVPDPKDATTVTVENNAQIVDDAGNQIDYQLAPVGGLTAEPAGATPDPGDTASPWLNAWDVDVPTFSSYTIADADPNVGTSFEIVTGVNATTQLIERFEFHILDNSALDLSNVSDANYFNTPQQPMVDGVWDPQALTDTGNVDYTTDLIHTDTRANEGVRDTTLAYPSDGLTETDAFAIEQVGVTPLRTDVNQAFNTEVNNTLYGVTNVNVANDSYFRLQIDGTAGAHPWGLLTEMYVQYDATVARITDLAGNLLPSTAVPIRAIERTPPTIDLALAIAGESRIYMKFSEPVFGSADRTQTIAYDDFRIVDQSGTDITAPVSLDVIATSQAGVAAGGYEEVFLNLADPLSATDILRARIKPVDQAPIDGSSSIYDKAENVLPVADERRVSDVAIGLVEPVWATDSFGINDAGAGNFRTIRTFDGSETLSRSDITIQARVDASATSLPSSILYGFDIESDLTSSGYWSPTALAGLVEVDETTDVREALPFETDAQLRTFMVPGDASGMNQADMLEFQFRLGPLNAARVTDPTDPRTVAPWKIGLGDGFIVQRNNVTILNNVIYPENGERTVLTYELSRPGMVSVIVFDLAGNVVRTIHRGRQGTGTFRYTWDGRNNSNQIVARGIYFIRVVAPGVDEYRKVIVAKD